MNFAASRKIDSVSNNFSSTDPSINSAADSGSANTTTSPSGPNTVSAPTITAFNETFLGQEKIFSKLDILWVIDNSGSMKSSQQGVADNFNSFISNLKAQNFDFQMAVTTTDAYLSDYSADASKSNFKMGGTSGYSGVAIMDSQTPNLSQVFIENVLQGTRGSGDERAFQSMRAALNNNNNSSFIREGSHLAVIVLSDEDDMSHNGTDQINNNTDPNLDPVTMYQTYLQQKKGSNQFSFNSISILDNACKDNLNTGEQKISDRYALLASLTQGTALSLCSPFGSNLDFLSKHIMRKINSFTLAKVPYQNKISVKINGSSVPEDAINGWTYDQSNNSLTFHGTFIPDTNAKVSVDYSVHSSAP